MKLGDIDGVSNKGIKINDSDAYHLVREGNAFGNIGLKMVCNGALVQNLSEEDDNWSVKRIDKFDSSKRPCKRCINKINEISEDNLMVCDICEQTNIESEVEIDEFEIEHHVRKNTSSVKVCMKCREELKPTE